MEGVSFAVEKGAFVALMGTSGSGKTTALRLVQGLFSPVAGQVKVNGVDTRDWDLAALRRRTALVPQDHMLFTGTIGENIAMGVPNASQEAIEDAAKQAEIHEFILTLPLGYDTPVEEKGRSLSGGQRQRIAIARALLAGADILLLDEVTSALDPKSDERILQTLAGLRGKKTILMVAHKKNALALADRCIDFTPRHLTKQG
jgi:ABC-type multidrug transport system fused ATPase/permease subunit